MRRSDTLESNKSITACADTSHTSKASLLSESDSVSAVNAKSHIITYHSPVRFLSTIPERTRVYSLTGLTLHRTPQAQVLQVNTIVDHI